MVIVLLPEDSVRGVSSVGNVVEKHIQLLVVIKVSSNDGAHRGGGCKCCSGYVLHTKTHYSQVIYYIRIVPFNPGLSGTHSLSVPHYRVPFPYPELVVAALQEKSVWAVPVAVDNVCLSIAVEVS